MTLYLDSSALVKLVIDEPETDDLWQYVGSRGLASLDALHVAGAAQLERALEALVSYDKRMIDAGRAAGLVVASPGDEAA